MVCSYGYAPRGETAYAYVWAPADANSRWSSISSMSIEGPQSNYLINTSDESINAATFLHVLQYDILPVMNPYPGIRSVLILDNCRIHQKFLIYAMCARKEGGPVLVLFLPPYSPDFNPIEKMFNNVKIAMQRRYGAGNMLSMENIFNECLWSSISPSQACAIFRSCYIDVSAEDEAWASR